MNLSGRFFVKSNYIRAAKDEWVLCDVRLLTDDTDTFLCIKSLPSSILLNGTNNYSESDDGKIPEKSPYRVENFATRPFTALCNLSEYKSCSMRTETVNSSASFALKLVPSGVFGNKKLLIATEDENEITTWLAICKACIGKKSRNGSSAQRDLACNMGTLSKSGSFMSLKPNSQACESEFDDALMDNEVYEAYSSEDKIPAVLEEAGDWVKLHLCQPDCYLRLTTDRLEVLDYYSHKPVHWFPYLLIRRFGAANGVLRVDAGRRCSTGDGKFFFRCSPPNGQPVDALVTQIRQLALEAKQRTKRSQMTSSNLELNVNNNNNANNGDINSGNHIKGTSFSHTTENHLGNDHMDSIHGTLPRARSKRAKVPGESSAHRSSSNNVNGCSGGGSGSSTECIPPKATPEPSDDTDPNALPSNAEVFKATPCKPPKSSPEPGNASNLYDNLPRPPRRGSRLPGAVNVLPLPTRSHKQKDPSLQTNSSTTGTLDSRNSSDTLDDLVELNSKHIGSPTSSSSITVTTTSPAVTPITPSTISTSALTPLPITSSSAFMFSRLNSSTSASSPLKIEKLETPSIPPHSSITTLNHIPSYNKNHETNTTSSSSSINFIDSSETKSGEASSCSPSPAPLTAITTTIPVTPTTPSANSMVKSLIQSYTSISQGNSNQVSNGYHENGMKNRLKPPSSLSVPTTISSTSLSLQSPSSLSASFAINNNTNTTLSDYDNSNESRTSIHNTSNKLINSTGIMRVPLSTNTHSAGGYSENQQQQQQQAASKFSNFNNSKISSASFYLRGPHPNTTIVNPATTSSSSLSSSVTGTLVTCSPTMNTVVQPIPLPIKVDSVFRAEKSTTRRSQDSNNSSLSNNNNTTITSANNNNNNNSLTNNAVNKTRVTKDDSRRYLSELDSVIKELCEANEAAVQATREAAQRRQRLGWPSTNSNHNSQIKLTTSTPTNETKIMPIPNSTNA